jgi:periplasmic protein TonB
VSGEREQSGERKHTQRGAESREAPLHHIVLGAVRSSPRRIVMYACASAAVLHVGGVALAVSLGSAPEAAPKKRASQPLVVFEHVVELEPPAPAVEVAPPPPAAPIVPPPVVRKAKAKAAPQPEPPAPAAPAEPPPPAEPAQAEQPPSEPPPAAQAGQVVAAAATGQAPSFAIATGSGQHYVGGTSSARGTGSQTNHTGQVGVGNGTGLNRARAAQLQTRNPPCGWPPEAEDSDLEEAFVTVRATIGPDGRASAVEVLSDPGYGFGKRMQWCIRTKMRFEPALDGEGRPVAGSTQPFRVRFVREE